MHQFLHDPTTEHSTYAPHMDPAEQAARDQVRAFVEAAFTEAAREGDVDQWIDLEPAEYVDVLVQTTNWWPGELRAWRRRGAAWEAWVRWHEAIGEQRVDWVPAERVKRVGEEGRE